MTLPRGRASDFDFLHGKWRVRHKTLVGRLQGATEWSEADGIDIVRPAFGGLGNIGRFMREVDGIPFEGVPIRLFDPKLKHWKIYWIDTFGQRMEAPVVGGFESGRGLFEGEDVLRKQKIRVRFEWSDITETKATWRQSFSPDAGRSWELNSIMKFTRDESLPDHPEFPISRL